MFNFFGGAEQHKTWEGKGELHSPILYSSSFCVGKLEGTFLLPLKSTSDTEPQSTRGDIAPVPLGTSHWMCSGAGNRARVLQGLGERHHAVLASPGDFCVQRAQSVRGSTAPTSLTVSENDLLSIPWDQRHRIQEVRKALVIVYVCRERARMSLRLFPTFYLLSLPSKATPPLLELIYSFNLIKVSQGPFHIFVPIYN